MNQEVANKMRSSIKRHEAYRRFLYKCPAGKWTIGFGHNLTDNGCDVEIANLWLEQDIKNATDDLFRSLPFVNDMDDVTQAILIEMTFTMGIVKVLKFTNMIEALKKYAKSKSADDRKIVSKEMLDSVWHKECPNRVEEMAYWMETGKM